MLLINYQKRGIVLENTSKKQA